MGRIPGLLCLLFVVAGWLAAGEAVAQRAAWTTASVPADRILRADEGDQVILTIRIEPSTTGESAIGFAIDLQADTASNADYVFTISSGDRGDYNSGLGTGNLFTRDNAINLMVNIRNDIRLEPEEFLTLRLTSHSNSSVMLPFDARPVTIRISSDPPTAFFDNDTQNVAEGDDGTISLSVVPRPATQSVAVGFAVGIQTDTARLGTDYTIAAHPDITFNPARGTGTIRATTDPNVSLAIPYRILNDAYLESEEFFTLRLTSHTADSGVPPFAEISRTRIVIEAGPQQAMLSIRPVSPAVDFEKAPGLQLIEGSQFRVRLTNLPVEGDRIALAQVDFSGNARLFDVLDFAGAASADITACRTAYACTRLDNGLNFRGANRQTWLLFIEEAPLEIDFTVHADDNMEDYENFTFALRQLISGADNAPVAVVPSSSVSVSIYPSGSEVSIGDTPAVVIEGQDFVVPVMIEEFAGHRQYSSIVHYAISTQSSSARFGADYTIDDSSDQITFDPATAAGTMQFYNDQRLLNLPIRVLADSEVENDETVSFRLTGHDAGDRSVGVRVNSALRTVTLRNAVDIEVSLRAETRTDETLETLDNPFQVRDSRNLVGFAVEFNARTSTSDVLVPWEIVGAADLVPGTSDASADDYRVFSAYGVPGPNIPLRAFLPYPAGTRSGELLFRAGRVRQELALRIEDDPVNEGAESLQVRLGRPRLVETDVLRQQELVSVSLGEISTATGIVTIVRSDPITIRPVASLQPVLPELEVPVPATLEGRTVGYRFESSAASGGDLIITWEARTSTHADANSVCRLTGALVICPATTGTVNTRADPEFAPADSEIVSQGADFIRGRVMLPAGSTVSTPATFRLRRDSLLENIEIYSVRVVSVEDPERRAGETTGTAPILWQIANQDIPQVGYVEIVPGDPDAVTAEGDVLSFQIRRTTTGFLRGLDIDTTRLLADWEIVILGDNPLETDDYEVLQSSQEGGTVELRNDLLPHVLNIRITDDLVNESTETLSVRLVEVRVNPATSRLTDLQGQEIYSFTISGTGIVQAEVAPSDPLQVSLVVLNALEEGTTGAFSVVLDGVSEGEVSVPLRLAAGTAALGSYSPFGDVTPGADYAIVPTPRLSVDAVAGVGAALFRAGERVARSVLLVHEDTLSEEEEIGLALLDSTAPGFRTGLRAGRVVPQTLAVRTVAIEDEEDDVIVGITPLSQVSEEGTTVDFSIGLSGGGLPTTDVSVGWSVSAEHRGDVDPASGTVVIRASDPAPVGVTLRVLHDGVEEPDEIGEVVLGQPVVGEGAAMTDGEAARFLIVRNLEFARRLVVGAMPAPLAEPGDRAGMVSSTWSVFIEGRAFSEDTEVAWRVVHVDTEDADFGAVSGTLVVAAGDADAITFDIPIVADNLSEVTETFAVRVDTQALATEIGAPSTATLTDAAEDEVVLTLVALDTNSAEAFVTEGARVQPRIVPSGALATRAITIPVMVQTEGAVSAELAPSTGTRVVMTADGVPAIVVSPTTARQPFAPVIQIGDDSRVEGAGRIIVTLGLPRSVLRVRGDLSARHRYTVSDNDTTVVEVSPPPGVVGEGFDAVFALTFSEGIPTFGDIAVDWHVEPVGSSPTVAADFGETTSTTVIRIDGPTLRGEIRVPIALDSPEHRDSDLETFRLRLTGVRGPRVRLGTAITAQASIEAGASARRFLSIRPVAAGARVREGERVYFDVELSGAPPQSGQPVMADWSVRGAGANPAESRDYSATVAPLVFAAGQSTAQQVSFRVTNDLENESAEGVIVALLNLRGGGDDGTRLYPGRGQVSVEIEASDALSYRVVGASTATEGGEAVFTVEWSENLVSEGDVVVPFTLSGSATPGVDYTAPAESVLRFPSGAQRAFVRLAVRDDPLNEAAEFITLRLEPPTHPAFAQSTQTGVVSLTNNPEQQAATVAIAASDPIRVGITPASQRVTEGRAAVFTFEIEGGNPGMDITAPWRISTADDAVGAGDFVLEALEGAFVIGATATPPHVLSLDIALDRETETTETFSVTLGALTSGPEDGPVVADPARSTASVVIPANQGAVRVLRVTGDDIAENFAGDAVRNYAVSLAGLSFPVATSVTWAVIHDTTEDADFRETAGTLVFMPGSLGPVRFPLTVVSDDFNEPGERFRLRATVADINADGGTASMLSPPIVIADSADDRIIVSIRRDGTQPLSEGQDAAFSVSLLGGLPTADVRVSFAVTPAEVGDFVIREPAGFPATAVGVLTIAVGSVANRIVLGVIDDELNEAAEPLRVRLTGVETAGRAEVSEIEGVAGAVISESDPLSVNLVADDAALSIAEGREAAFEVRLNRASAGDLTIGWETAVTEQSTQDRANSETFPDFTAPGADIAAGRISGSVTIAAGETGAMVRFDVAQDARSETLESAVFRLVGVSGDARAGAVALGAADRKSFTIPASVGATRFVEIAAARSIVGEGDTVELTVALRGAAPELGDPVRVDWGIAGSGANPAEAGDTTGGGTVLFSSLGRRERRVSFRVTDDDSNEGAETLVARLTNVRGGGGLGAALAEGRNEVALTIEASDPLTYGIGGGGAVDEGGNAVFTVSFDRVSEGDVAVGYRFGAADSAVSYLDYEPPSPQRVTVEAGATATALTIPVIEDTINEATETFVVILSGEVTQDLRAGVALADAANDRRTVAIADNDPVIVRITPMTQVVTEGRSARFTLEASGGLRLADITVPWQVDLGDTDPSGDDLELLFLTGSTVIPGIDTTAVFHIDTRADGASETTETFSVSLLDLSGGLVAGAIDGEGTATVVIRASAATDRILSVVSGPANPTEGTSFSYQIALPESAAVFTDDLEVSWRVVHLDTEDADFGAVAGSVTLPAGGRNANFGLTYVGDSLVENRENFQIVLTVPTDVAVGVGTPYPVTLHDTNRSLYVSVRLTPNQLDEEFITGDPGRGVNEGLQVSEGRQVFFDVVLFGRDGMSGNEVLEQDVTIPFRVVGDSLDDVRIVEPRGFAAASTAGTLVIPAGSVEGRIILQTIDDAVGENAEEVGVELPDTLTVQRVAESLLVRVTDHPLDLIRLPTRAVFDVLRSDLPTLRITPVAGLDLDADTAGLQVVEGDAVLFELSLSNPIPFPVDVGWQALYRFGEQTNTDSDPASPRRVNLDQESESDFARLPELVPATSMAAIGADVFFVSEGFEIPAGATTGVIGVGINRDERTEDDETFAFQITNLAPRIPMASALQSIQQLILITIGAEASTSVTILANNADPRFVSLRADRAVASEGGQLALPIELAGDAPESGNPVTVDWFVGPGPGNPAEEDDYMIAAGARQPGGVTTGTVTFTATGTRTVLVTITDDAVNESTETLVVRLTDVRGGGGFGTGIDGRRNAASIAIAQSDPLTYRMTGPGAVAEGTTATFAVVFSNASEGDVTVGFRIGGSALDGEDYLEPAPLTFAAGMLRRDLLIPVADDPLNEAQETIEITVDAVTAREFMQSTQSGVVLRTDDADARVGRATILASDPIALSIEAPAEVAYEGGAARFTLTLNGGALSSDISVPWRISGTVAAADLNPASLEGVFMVSRAGGRQHDFAIDIPFDGVAEAEESLSVRIGAPPVDAPFTITTDTATVTIAANGADFVRTLSVGGPAIVAEGAGDVSATYTVSLTGRPFVNRTVMTWRLFAGEGDALAESVDFAFTSGELALAAGATRGTFDLIVIPDGLNEVTETFSLQVSVLDATADGGTVFGAAFESAISDDPADTIYVSVPSVVVNVQEGGDSDAIALGLRGGVPGDAPVVLPYTLTLSGSGVEDRSGYALVFESAGVEVSEDTVTIPASVFATTRTRVVLRSVDDDYNEPSAALGVRQAEVQFGDPVRGRSFIEGGNSLRLTVEDNDPTTVSLAPPAGTAYDAGNPVFRDIFEGGDAVFPVRFTGGIPTLDIPIAWSITHEGSTPTEAADFVDGIRSGVVSTTMVTVPGVRVPVTGAEIRIPIARDTPDSTDNQAETFTFRLLPVADSHQLSLGTTATAASAIIRAEPLPGQFLSLSADRVIIDEDAAEESARRVELTVALEGEPVSATDPVTVLFGIEGDARDYEVLDGAAPFMPTPGGVSTSTITFTRLGTTATRIVIVNDALNESADTLVVSLRQASGGGHPAGVGLRAGRESVSVVIEPSDPITYRLRAPPVGSVSEERPGTLSWGLELSGESQGAVTVPLEFGGSATRGVDYTATTDTVAMAMGMGTTFSALTVTDDNLNESAETISLSLSASPVLGAGAGQVTRADDDSGHTLTIRASDPAWFSIEALQSEAPEGVAARFSVRLTDNAAAPGDAVVASAPVSLSYTVFTSSPNAQGDTPDFTDEGRGVVVVAAGNSSAMLVILVNEDGLSDPDEVLTVRLDSAAVSPGGGRVSAGGSRQATVVIPRSAAAVRTIRTAPLSSMVAEGTSATWVVTLSLSQGTTLSEVVSVSWEAVAVSAADGVNPAEAADFADGAFGAGQVSFAAGAADGATATFALSIADDTLNEGDEDFELSLRLTQPAEGTFVAQPRLEASITDDEADAVVFAHRLSLRDRFVNAFATQATRFELSSAVTGAVVPTLTEDAIIPWTMVMTGTGVEITDILSLSVRFDVAPPVIDERAQIVTRTGMVIVPAGTSGDVSFRYRVMPTLYNLGEMSSLLTFGDPQTAGRTVNRLESAFIFVDAMEPTSVSIAEAPEEAAEGGDAVFPVYFTDSIPTQGMQLDWAVVHGGAAGVPATVDADFVAITGTTLITVPQTPFSSAATTRGEILVGIARDTLLHRDDRRESFSLSLTGARGGGASGMRIMPSTPTGVIQRFGQADRELAVSAVAGTVNEGDTARLRVSLSGVAPESGNPVMVDWMVSGDASDYTAQTGTLTFSAPGSRELEVMITDDALNESSETLVVSLLDASGGGGLGVRVSQGRVVLEIAPSDPLTYGIAAQESEVAEGGTAMFRVTLSGESAGEVAVPYTIGGDVVEDDYSAPQALRAVIAAGTTATTLELFVTDDSINESAESLRLIPAATAEVGAGGGVVTRGAIVSATVTIPSNDALTLSLGPPMQTVEEGSSARFQFSVAGGEPGVSFEVPYTVSGVDADDIDLGGALTGTAAFTAGATTQEHQIGVLFDGAAESTETMSVTLGAVSPPSGAGVILLSAASASAVVTIPQNTTAARTLMLRGPELLEEGAANVAGVWTASLVGRAFSSTTTVTWSVTPETASAEDFLQTSGQVEVPANTTQSSTFMITLLPDRLNESTESFTVQLGIGNAGLDGGTAIGEPWRTRIADAAADAIEVSIAAVQSSLSEGDSGDFRVTLSGGEPTGEVVVPFMISGASASDYTATTDRVTIGAGGASATITIAITDDDLNEAQETLRVVLGQPQTTGGLIRVGASGSAGVAIRQSDPAEVTLLRAPGAGEEVREGDTAVFIVALSAASAGSVSMDWTAAIGLQRNAPGMSNTGAFPDLSPVSGLVDIAPGQTTAAFSFFILRDARAEGAETVSIALSRLLSHAGSGEVSLAGGEQRLSLTIPANTAESRFVAIETARERAGEGESVSLVVSLDGFAPLSGNPVMVDLAVSGTGVTSGDYSLSVDTLTFAGVGTRSVSLMITDDAVNESTETLVVSLSNVRGGGGLGAALSLGREAVMVEIAPSDPLTYGIVADAAEVTEGAMALFRVTLSGESAGDVTVPYTIGGGVSAADYTASSELRTTIVAGTTGATIELGIADDDRSEGNEALRVVLDAVAEVGAGGGEVTRGAATSATVTILANDPLTLSLGPPMQNVEEGDTARFTLSFAGNQPDAPVRVPYTVSGVSAGDVGLNGALSGETIISTGTTSHRFGLAIVYDNTAEPTETLMVTLGAPTVMAGGGAVSVNAASASASVTIAANEAHARTLTLSGPAEFAEGAFDSYGVVLNGRPFADDTEVRWRILPGGPDFSESGGEVMFGSADGDGASRGFQVIAAADGLNEGDEFFTVEISVDDATADGGTLTSDAIRVRVTDAPADAIVVGISPASPTVFESRDAAFILTLSGGRPTSDVVVVYDISGAGITPSDFRPPPANLVGNEFMVGADEFPYRALLSISEDDIPDEPETLTLTLQSARSIGEARPGTMRTAQVTIMSAAARQAFVEEGAMATWVLTLSLPQGATLSEVVSVPWEAVAVSAAYGVNPAEAADFPGGVFPTGEVLFAAGAANGTTATFTLLTADDMLNEGVEDFQLSLGLPQPAQGVFVAQPQLEVSIADDADDAVVFSHSLTLEDQHGEGFEASIASIALSSVVTGTVVPTLTEDAIIPWTMVMTGTGVQIARMFSNALRIDVAPLVIDERAQIVTLTGTIIVPAGTTGDAFRHIRFPTPYNQGAMSVQLTFGDPQTAGRTVNRLSSVSQIIVATQPTSVSIAEAPEATEGGDAVFPVHFTGKIPTQGLELDWAVEHGGAPGVPATVDADFVAITGTTLIAVPQTPFSSAATTRGEIRVGIARDMPLHSDGRNEGFSLRLTGARGGGGSGMRILTATAAGVIQHVALADRELRLLAESVLFNEGDTARFDVTLSGLEPEAGNPVRVEWMVTGDAGDYMAQTGTLTFSALGSRELAVMITDDALNESTGTLVVSLRDARGGGGGDDVLIVVGRVMIEIAPSDPLTWGIAAQESGVAEGGTAMFRVTLSGESAGDVTVPYTIGGDVSAGDYTAPPQLRTTIVAGATGATIALDIADDNLNEGNEGLRVIPGAAVVGAGAGEVTPGAATSATVTILASDPLTLSLGPPQQSVEEGGTARFTLRVDGGVPGAAVVAPYTVSGVSAGDVGLNGTLAGETIISTGVTNHRFGLVIAYDNTAESTETLMVTLGAPSATAGGGAVGVNAASATANVAIAANEAIARTLTLSGPAELAEGAAGSYNVVLSGRAFSGDTAVQWRTLPAGSDFSESGGEVMFGSGDGDGASRGFQVTAAADGLNEGDEFFTVEVGVGDATADGGTLTSGAVRVRVTDDPDDAITVGISPASQNVLESTPATFTIDLSGGRPTSDVVVVYDISGNGITLADFSPPLTNLVGNEFVVGAADGPPYRALLGTFQDDISDEPETLTLTLQSVRSAGVTRLGTARTAQVTILTFTGLPVRIRVFLEGAVIP